MFLSPELGKYYWCPDENFKAALKGPALNEIVPFYMKKIDAIIKSNNGFLANGKVRNIEFVSILFLFKICFFY